MQSKTTQLTLTLITLTFSACGPQNLNSNVSPELASRDRSVHHGVAPNADAAIRKSVVFLFACRDEKTCGTCTGTLVSRTHVLTAAHCMAGAKTIALQGYGDNFDPSIADDKRTFIFQAGITEVASPIAGLETAANWEAVKGTANQDLALVTLAQEAPADRVALPIVTTEAIAAAKSVRIAAYGYGLTETGSSGVLQGCELSPDAYTKHLARSERTNNNYGFMFYCGKTEQRLDFGDSGGPVVIELDGKSHLLGVIHGGIQPNEKEMAAAKEANNPLLAMTINIAADLLSEPSQVWLKTVNGKLAQ